MRCPLVVIVLFIGLCTSVQAQWPHFRQHPVKDVADFQPGVMTQDRHGWLWIGGVGGLMRYDGQQYHPVLLPDGTRGTVTALFADEYRLWVGFKDGRVTYLDLAAPFLPQLVNATSVDLSQSVRLQAWSPSDSFPSVPVSGFAVDGAHDFWIATYGAGLYCVREGRPAVFEGLASQDIYALATAEDGRIWAATDAGIHICGWSPTGKPVVQRLGPSEGLPDEIITALLPDPSGGMWIGTYDRGICRYDYQTNAFSFPVGNWPGHHVNALTLFGQTELWIGTEGHGCFRFDLTEGRLMSQPSEHSLARERIRALFKDREGLLWILSERRGVFSANVRFTRLDASMPEIQAVLVDRRRRLWVGTATGLFLRDGDRFIPALPRTSNIISLSESAEGQILAGSFGEGLWVVDGSGGQVHRITEKDGLRNGSVLSIACAGDTIWLATLGGVMYSEKGTKGDFQPMKELGAGYVYSIYAEPGGRIWFGADGKGLSVLENGRWRAVGPEQGKTFKTVTDIHSDTLGHIWFTTPDAGLWRYNGSRFDQFTTDRQLHSMDMLGLERDGHGNLVVIYSDGLDIVNPSTGHVAYYGRGAGLPPFETALNAHHTDAQGNVWLGAAQGLLKIAAYREQFIIDPQPSITAVTVFMKPIDFNTQVNFAHDQNYLVFYFTGLWYTNPEAVRYRYRLEGYDLDWKVTKDRLASYSNLPPGRYRFRFQSSEHGTFEHTPEAGYEFVIERPFWTQWWFILPSVFILVALLYSWVRQREKRFQREASLRRQKSDSQFAALKSQINPHFLFNSFNTLITIIEENPKAAVEYVEHLSDFYRSMMAYREKDLISIREEMELVHNFYFLLQKRFESNFILHTDIKIAHGNIMPLTLQMLLENAVKHNVISKAKPLRVDIYTEDQRWIVVRNNIQLKIKPEPSTFFGLQSLKERYQLLGNYPVIVEQNQQFFIVKVPIIPSL